MGLLDKLTRRVTEDVISKIKNRINYVINQRNYVFDEPLRQQGSPRDKEGDFLYEYAVTRTFESPEEMAAFTEDLEKSKEALRLALALDGSVVGPDGPHLYDPLLDEDQKKSEVRVSPDLLNTGEKKFLEDLAAYAKSRFPPDGSYELYVFRNVESLKSVGVFLEDDEGGYFPDFVVWVVEKETDRTWLILADPKGQRGMTDEFNPNEMNEKVRLGLREEGGALRMLDEALTEKWSRPVQVHSFILVRDKSGMGRAPGRDNAEWAEKHMLPYNVLRLDWHAKNENGYTSPRRNTWGGRSYL